MEKKSHIEQVMIEFGEIREVLDERGIRIWCAAKARAYNRIYGRGGATIVFEATGVSRSCIYQGIKEIEQGIRSENNQIRKKGGGRKKNH